MTKEKLRVNMQTRKKKNNEEEVKSKGITKMEIRRNNNESVVKII